MPDGRIRVSPADSGRAAIDDRDRRSRTTRRRARGPRQSANRVVRPTEARSQRLRPVRSRPRRAAATASTSATPSIQIQRSEPRPIDLARLGEHERRDHPDREREAGEVELCGQRVPGRLGTAQERARRSGPLRSSSRVACRTAAPIGHASTPAAPNAHATAATSPRRRDVRPLTDDPGRRPTRAAIGRR